MWSNYANIRKKIKTGDVFFTASPALFSRLIRWKTKSTVSHVGLFVWIGARLFAVESLEGRGATMTLASTRFKDTPIIVARPTKVPKTIIDDVLDDVGVLGYDVFGAVVSPWFDTKSLRAFCSEWVVRRLKIQDGFKHFTNGITPKDVLTYLSDGLVTKKGIYRKLK